MTDENTSEELLLSMEQVLAANDIRYKTILVPEWGGSIRIASLTAEHFIEWEESNKGPAARHAGILLLIRSLVDSNGNRIGNDKDLPAWKRKSVKVVSRIIQDVMRFNDMLKPEFDKLKNASGGAPIDASPTDSPLPSADLT